MLQDINSIVWNEKYRPNKIDDFLISDDLKELMKEYVKDQTLDNIILYGSTGVGKTSITRYLLDNIECEVLSINASEERGIDTIREKVVPFCQRNSLFSLKVVDFREGEKLTKDSQDALKDIIEESYEDTKFIFTTNNVSGIIPPIRGRFTEIEVYPSDMEKVAVRMMDILNKEDIEISKDEKKKLWKFIQYKYPNIRQIINTIQVSSRSGTFKLMESESFDDHFKDIVEVINSNESVDKKYKSIRGIINSIPMSGVDEIFKYLYSNIDDININDKMSLINIIAQYNYQSGLVVDKEINVASMLIEIIKLK